MLEGGAGSIDPAFYGAELAAADLSDALVAKPVYHREYQDLAMHTAQGLERALVPRGDQAGTGPTIRMTDKAGVATRGGRSPTGVTTLATARS